MTKEQMPDISKWSAVLVQVVTGVILITGAFFTMPQKISAEVDAKLCDYVRKDVHAVQQEALIDKMDSIMAMMKDIQRKANK